MPDIIKIGITSRADLTHRLKELDNTSLPLPFECYCAYDISDNLKEVEQNIHYAFGDYRIRKNREFFKSLTPDRVEKILKLIGSDVTPHRQNEESTKELLVFSERQQKLKFEMLNIPVGSVLFFTKDSSITCITQDNVSNVIFDNKIQSISAAALSALHSIGMEWKSAQGGMFWAYSEDGEPENASSLVQIRNNKASEQNLCD